MWKIWWASNNASKWQMGFNSAFKGLTGRVCVKHKITLEMCGYKIPGMNLSWVLTSYVRRDPVICKLLNVFWIYLILKILQNCFFYQQSAYCIVVCLCASGARGGAVGWSSTIKFVVVAHPDVFLIICIQKYDKSRKVAGSIPDGVTGMFHWH
jgi:hypothetical protein